MDTYLPHLSYLNGPALYFTGSSAFFAAPENTTRKTDIVLFTKN